MGHPGLLYRDGFQYAYASFYAITIPFTGVIFLIIASASILGWWMTFEQIPQAIAQGFLSLSQNPTAIIGMILLTISLLYVLAGKVTSSRFSMLDNSGLYWHLVDLIWIFVFPLFYLVL